MYMSPQPIPSLKGATVITTVVIIVVLIALCLVLWMYRNTPLLAPLLGSQTNTGVEVVADQPAQ